MAYKIAAAIDIGSSAVRMEISEKRKSEVKCLEFLQSPLYLGHDTFTRGRISFEKIERLCEILNSYLDTANQYGVPTVETVATTAFREAENKEYVLDLVKLKTGISVRILEDPEEKTIMYREMLRRDEGSWKNAVISYVGTGSLGIAIMEKGLLRFTQNIRIGSLKLSEILEPVEGYTKKFHMIIEQYISTYIDVLKNLLSLDRKTEFVASGKEIDLIARLMDIEITDSFFTIPKKAYVDFYDSIKTLTPMQIADMFDLPQDRAEILLPSAALFKILMDFSKSDTLTGCNITMCDALVYKELYPNKFDKVNARFNKSIINSAIFAARRFRYDRTHIAAVYDYSTIIFDSIREVHGLSDREKLLLQIACILHDCGKFVNLKEHYDHSYDLIKRLSLPGLNSRELNIIANVSKYHSDMVPKPEHDNFSSLDSNDRVLVAKLSAIIRLGDSLDKSHLQKFGEIDAVYNNNELVITAKTGGEATLEEWAFSQKAVFFNDVFGIRATLMIERTM
ncbi:MAG: HD domain-containing protein [Clostridia bacterium]|jgi:exopolyphosphatase/guanosine-5'-triphosphate,3'-diphosphate pyrophosphatase|nr:HD domain-containing protein [Clostridia bacterium]